MNLLFKKQNGATAIEYALIAGLIMLVIIGAVNSFSSSTSSMYSKITSGVDGATGL